MTVSMSFCRGLMFITLHL